MLESMLKICIYTGINADVTLEDGRTDGQRTECEDRARILKQNSQFDETMLECWVMNNILKIFSEREKQRYHE